jgi:hypothetical protein
MTGRDGAVAECAAALFIYRAMPPSVQTYSAGSGWL